MLPPLLGGGEAKSGSHTVTDRTLGNYKAVNMKSDEIKSLFDKFESIACEYDGVECWSARELCSLLGYAKWERFEGVISRAEEACENAGVNPSNHFPSTGKMIVLAKGAQREVTDYMLTRYACYLVAQNGDPRKPEISFAQNYFAVQNMLLSRGIVPERLPASEDVKKVERRLASDEKKVLPRK